ncbi:MAG: LysR family transcriptional regulator [Kofleriaceae bacterium]|nr:LysR family transcriptional regulator [Kofleriaceae bacterium]
MSWEDLRYLEALSRKGNAQAAARELGVSASTVYRRVAALEAEIGGTCLHKGGDAGELTETGKRLVVMARDIRTGMGRIRSQSEANSKGLRGKVGLTTVDGMVPLLGEPLRQLSDSYPGLSVELIVGDSGPSVRKHQVDVAIGVMLRPPEELIGRSLFRIEYAVYGTTASVAREPLHWIRRGPPISFTPESEWEDEHAGKAAVRTGTVSAMLSLVQSGVGVGLLPKRSAELHPELVELPEYTQSLGGLAVREAWLLVHPETRKNPKVRALFDLLLRHFLG